MPSFTVDIDAWELKDHGYIHEDDLEDEGWVKKEDFKDFKNPVEHYLFRENPEITPALKDILEIIGVEVWRLKSVQ